MKCPHCNVDVVLYRQINQSGAKVVVERCPSCRRAPDLKHAFLPKSSVEDWDNLPLFEDYAEQSEPCAVRGCTNIGTENHHIAPRSVFFEEAEDWPQFWLCIPHHRRWHDMTGLAIGGKREHA